MSAPREQSWFGHPAGLNTLFFTEMWERFSYYGMRAILMYYMLAPPAAGGLGFSLPRAGLIYGTYTMCVYLFSIPGGYLADNFFGAKRTVLGAGVMIAAGHFVLALPFGGSFFLGLALVALGSGLLKPNMSTMVGSLYGKDDPRRDAGFSIFYLGINLGAFIAPFATGFLAQHPWWKARLAAWGFNPAHSWHWGFAAADVGMSFALVVFVLRRNTIAGLGEPPPRERARPWGKAALLWAGIALFLVYVFQSDQPGWQWMRSAFAIVPIAAVLWFAFRRDVESRRLAAVFIFVIAAMAFWALYEQVGTTLAVFADRLTRSQILGVAFPSSWFQSLNPIFIVLLAPAFAWLWVKLGDRQPSSPAKFAFGLILQALAFALMIPAAALTALGRVGPGWLIGVLFLQTLGELCLSPVGLSTMTKLAPERLAGVIMGIWLLSDAFGNKVAGMLAGQLDMANPHALVVFFERQALVLAGFALALLGLSPWVRRLMGGIR